MSFLALHETNLPSFSILDCRRLEIEAVKMTTRNTVTVDQRDPDFFSVYARDPEGKAECIGDFGQYAWAHKYAVDLATRHGIIVEDKVPEVFK